MANQYVNKVVVKNEQGVEETKLDLTGDTIDMNWVLPSMTFHDKTGAQQAGTANDYADGMSAFQYTDTDGNTFSALAARGEDGQPATATLTNPKTLNLKGIFYGNGEGLIATCDFTNSVSYTLEDNDAGGQTLTIG